MNRSGLALFARRPVRVMFVAAVVAAALPVSATAFAMPVGSRGSEPPVSTAVNLSSASDSSVDFTSIVALSNCSGSLVRFTTSKPTDKGMVLTNGHCLEGGFVNAGEAVVGRPSTREFSLLSSDGSATAGRLQASEVMYATMTGTDFTLYRLTDTFADIESQYGVTGLTISDTHPAAGTPIRIVSGFWRRIYACTIQKFVYQVKEGEWTFEDSIRLSEPGCETIGGTSGSPIVDASTKKVIGINNTGNQAGESCTFDNPCEVDAQGNISAAKGNSYGQEMYEIYSCLTPANEIDLTFPGCKLVKPQSFTTAR